MLSKLKKILVSWNVHHQSIQEKELKFHDSSILQNHAILIGNKNNSLLIILNELQLLKQDYETGKRHQRIIESIKSIIHSTREWDLFDYYFDDANKDFREFVQRRYPKITSNELRLMSLMKIKLSNIEIGNTLNISQEGVKKARYRLRKKLGLKTSESLGQFIITF